MNTILEKINKSALRFLTPLTPEETYPIIVMEAIKLVGAERGSIFLPDPSTGLLTRVFASYPDLYQVQIRKKGITYNTFKTRQPIVITKTALLYKIQPKFKKIGIRSLISIPLSYKNRSIGVLSLHSLKKELFTKKELDILKLFGSMASLVIRKSQLYNETRRALETRDLFISMAAHELRTPLTTISGYIQLLQSRLSGTNSSESKWVEELSWENYRLTKLVNELLAINSIKNGQLNYSWKECHIKDIVQRVVTIFKFTHPGRILTISDSIEKGDDKVIGDYDKLLQVLTNLLDNATKFSSRNSPIKLSISRKKNLLALEVKDQGQGILDQDLDRIFEIYYRGEQQVEGMGLGLALVKYIVASHHGELKIHSKINKGTTMRVELPQANI